MLTVLKAARPARAREMFARVVGNPAAIIKTVSDEMIRWKTEGTALYQAFPGEMKESWAACEPLPETSVTDPGTVRQPGSGMTRQPGNGKDPESPDSPQKTYQPWEGGK